MPQMVGFERSALAVVFAQMVGLAQVPPFAALVLIAIRVAFAPMPPWE
jgi:hypothetical protein